MGAQGVWGAQALASLGCTMVVLESVVRDAAARVQNKIQGPRLYEMKFPAQQDEACQTLERHVELQGPCMIFRFPK